MKNLFFAIALVFLAASCKKEAKIEKNLWKGDGVWTIEKYEYKELWYGDNYSNTVLNAGTMTFNEDGTGVFKYVEGSYTEEDNFIWTVADENTIHIAMWEDIMKFDLTWKKDEVKIYHKNISSSNSDNWVSIEMDLKKK